KERYPLLANACKTIGSTQIRNRATIGGNTVNAAPCADSIPPAIIYDAQVVLQSVRGTRSMPLSEFLISGYKTQKEADELLVEVILQPPPPAHVIELYDQLGRRNALNITRQSLTALLGTDANGNINYCRMVDGSLFSKPQRLTEVEQALTGRPLSDESLQQAEEILTRQIDQAIGKRWSAAYKMPVFINMFRDMMQGARQRLSANKAH
ncbi:MAG: FAD binding domain-containing protein, partial [Enterobacteriaceae bacterium]